MPVVKPTRRGRWVPGLLTLGALALAACGQAVAQQPRAVEVENVRIGFDDRFKVGTWTPVRLQLRGGPVGFAGVIELVTNDADGTPTTVRQQVAVAAGGSQRVTLYTRPGSLDAEMFIRFYDGKSGRKVGPDLSTLALMGNKNLNPLWAEDLSILALGTPAGVEIIPTIPGFSPSNVSGRIREVSVVKINVIDDLLPAFRQGYDAMDAIILDTADKAMMAQVGAKIDGIEQWVRAGGHLVLSVGSNWQEVNERLGKLLPAKLEGQVAVNDLGSIESFVTGTTSPLLPVGSEAVQVAKITGVEQEGSKVLASTASNPLIVRGTFGFGRVTMIGLDTDRPPFRTWDDRKNFWVKAADLKPVTASNKNVATNRGRFIQSDVNDLATQLRRSLDQFPKVKLVPFGYVAFFIFLYILLIGPGDYFFLKKVLKRMELTWITFPIIVLSVSLVAYYAAYVIKGTELRVNKVDVLDIDQQDGLARGMSFANVFSPRNDDYNVSLTPLSLASPAPEPGATIPPPPAATQTLVSWFAASESGLRGMNTGRRGVGFGAAGYAYTPLGKAEELADVRIPIWSTKCFQSSWIGPATTNPIESDFVLVGTDRLNGTFTNRLGIPIEDVIVAFNGTVYYNIGTVAPNATTRIETQSNRTLSGYLNDLRPKYLSADYFQSNAIQRDPLLRAVLFRDSDVGSQGEIPSRVLHGLDLTGQLQLNRPMVIGRIARPVAALGLGDGKIKPEVDQTTLLRVVLPVARNTPAKPN